MAIITCKICNNIIDNKTGEKANTETNSVLALQEENKDLRNEIKEIRELITNPKKEDEEIPPKKEDEEDDGY